MRKSLICRKEGEKVNHIQDQKTKNKRKVLQTKEFLVSDRKLRENPLSHLSDLDKQRIAIELYLVKSLTNVHYQSLMSTVPKNTASKNSLLAWINDRNTEDKQDGLGIISRYKLSNPEHFENGKWKTEKFGEFLGYVADLLRSKSFFGNNKNAYKLFRESLKYDDWWYKATAVITLKLLEDLYKNNGMTSVFAEEILRTNFATREILSASGRIIGRVGKNSDLKEDDKEVLQGLISDMYPKLFANLKKSHFYTFENMLHNEYYDSIQERVLKVRKKSLSGLKEQLQLLI